MSDVFKQLDEKLVGQPANPLRKHQVDEYHIERDRLAKIANAGPHVPGDRGDAMKRLGQVNKALRDDVVKPIPSRDRDQVAKLVKEAEGSIRERLLPVNHMEKGPVGALGHFQRNEGSTEMVNEILTWKRAKLALDPENTDPDHLNTDYLRPISWAGAPSYRTDNLTKTSMGMTPQAKENWPLGEPVVDTALKQARLAEARRIVDEAAAEERAHEIAEKRRQSLVKARASRKPSGTARASEVGDDDANQ